VEIELGGILLDSVNLGMIGLLGVQGWGMAIIPQNPFLASATLQECLDPFGQHPKNKIVGVPSRSNSDVDNATLLLTRLDKGELFGRWATTLNFVRALLLQPKLLVLDKATTSTSIDGETDAFIQKMLKTCFPSTTFVTAVHCLNTIMDYNVVLVMDAGRAVEFGSPVDLLKKSSEGWKALQEMAIQAFECVS
jgi:ABC-type multidrug transport system fused ATPase/permease subunit